MDARWGDVREVFLFLVWGHLTVDGTRLTGLGAFHPYDYWPPLPHGVSPKPIDPTRYRGNTP